MVRKPKNPCQMTDQQIQREIRNCANISLAIFWQAFMTNHKKWEIGVSVNHLIGSSIRYGQKSTKKAKAEMDKAKKQLLEELRVYKSRSRLK